MEKFLAVAPVIGGLSGFFSFLFLSFLIYFVRGTLYVNTKEKERPQGLEKRLLIGSTSATVLAFSYESYAFFTGHASISHFVLNGIAHHAPVSWFCGLAATFFFTVAVFKTKVHWGLRCLSAFWLVVLVYFFWRAGALYSNADHETPGAAVMGSGPEINRR